MAFSSLLGSEDGVLGLNLVPGLAGDAGAYVPGDIFVTAASPLSALDHDTVGSNFIVSRSAVGNLGITLTHSNRIPLVISLDGSSALAFSSNEGDTNMEYRTAYSAACFTDANEYSFTSNEDVVVTSLLSLDQSSESSINYRTGGKRLGVYQFVNLTITRPDTLPGESPKSESLIGTSSLVLVQNNLNTITGINYTITADNTLSLGQFTAEPIELDSVNTLSISQESLTFKGSEVYTLLPIRHSAVVRLADSHFAANTLVIKQQFVYSHMRNGVIVSSGGNPCRVTESFSPFSGGGENPMAQSSPARIRRTDVSFFYPAADINTATDIVTLRTPNFGDRDKFGFDRVNRETRGGSLSVFRDPQWPSQRTLHMDFSSICDAEVSDVLAFLETTLGQEVGFLDWEDLTWKGIIINPDAGIVRHRTDGNDLAIEMDSELQ